MPRGGYRPLEVDRALVCWPRGKRAAGRGHLVAASGRRGPHRYTPNLGFRRGGDPYFVLVCCDTVLLALRACKCGDSAGQWRTQEFCWRGGVQQIQLRTEDRENGDLGAVAP